MENELVCPFCGAYFLSGTNEMLIDGEWVKISPNVCPHCGAYESGFGEPTHPVEHRDGWEKVI